MVKYIPSFITMINICCGFLAICMGDYLVSSFLIFACLWLDVLDGALARYLNAQSALGKELDSLADLVSFGIAPAYLYYTLSPLEGWMSYVPASFIVIGGTLRLAKFNVAPSGKYFNGLAIPANAFFFLGLFLAIHYKSEFVTSILDNPIIYFIIPLFFGFLMLSKLEMFSLKEAHLGVSKNLFQIACFTQWLVLMYFVPKMAIPISVFGYILLAMIESATRMRKS